MEVLEGVVILAVALADVRVRAWLRALPGLHRATKGAAA
jgi:hypothetical protein